jgi:hypothetical protein
VLIALALAWANAAYAAPGTNYSVRFGGSNGDYPTAITANENGTYITGYTYSTNFPGAPPRTSAITNDADVFVTKLNAAGDIVWSVVMGGSSFESPADIATDRAGNVYVAGRTTSTNFPTLNPFQASASTNGSAFVFKLDPTGSLVYSTYLTTNFAATAITVNTNTHEAIVTGTTSYIGTGDVFVARLGAFGTNLTLSASLGGSGFESPSAVALDGLNNIYVAGWTSSPDFPVTTNAYRETSAFGGPFLTKFDHASGSPTYSALLGSSALSVRALAVDVGGAAYVAGTERQTEGIRLAPRTPGAPPPPPTVTWNSNAAFLVRVAPSGSQLDYLRKYDTSSSDSLDALMLDSTGVLHLAGNVGQHLFSAKIADPANAPAVGFSSFTAFTDCGMAALHLFAFDPSGNLHHVPASGPSAGSQRGIPPPPSVYESGRSADVVANSYAIPLLSLKPRPVVSLSLLNSYGDRFSSNEIIYVRVDGGDLRSELAAISIHSGTNIIATFDGVPSLLALTNLPPGTYSLAATARNTLGGQGTSCPLTFTVAPAPRNDSFYRSTHINGTSYVTNATNEGASAERGEPAVSSIYDATPRRTVWWCWEAPVSGPFAIEVISQEISPRVGIYVGPNLSELDEVASFGPRANVVSAFKATVGTHYFFVVDSVYSGDFVFRLRPATPPVNDDYTNSIALTGRNFTVNGSNVEATREPTLAIDSADFPGSVWWRWTAPDAGQFVASVASQTFSPLISVHKIGTTGSMPGYAQSVISFSAAAGEQFDFRVAADYGEMGNFTLSLSNALVVPPPPNDNFASAALIAAFPDSESGTTRGATREPDEPGSANASVWYRWIAQSNITVAVEITPNSGAQVRAFSGTALSNLVPVGAEPGSSIAVFHAVGGREYYFPVADYYGATDFTLTVRAAQSPTNDNFADAIVLNGFPVTVAGSNREASLELHEPSHFEESVWYRWVAPSNGHYILSIETTSYRSFLVTPYTGSSIATLTPATPATPAPDLNFSTRLPGTAGTEYYLAVSGYAGSGDLFSLRIRPVVPPVNDNFADRIPLSGTTTEGSTIDASAESGEPLEDSFADKTVWWSWTAPESRKVSVWLSNASEFLRCRVFNGTSLSTLSLVGSGPGSSELILDAQAGQTYAIQVSGRRPATFVLNVAPLLPPPNDHFRNAFTLTGSSPSATGVAWGATREPGEFSPSFIYGGSLWWNWTAPAGGRVTLDCDHAVIVYTGASVSSLTNVSDPNRFFGGATFIARAGVTYRIAVYATSIRPFQLLLVAPAPPPIPQLEALRRLSNGGFEFEFNAIYSQTNVVEASSDLLNWLPISTNFFDCGILTIADPSGSGLPHRFYRLRAE